MKNLADIKRRLASVKQTRQITGAMETVSVAKLRKATELLERNSAYFDTLCAVMREIAASDDPDVKDLVAPPDTDNKLAVVIASDKGLCGSFNHDVFKFADAVIDENTVVMPLGKLACEYFMRRGVKVDDEFAWTLPDYSRAKPVADKIIEKYMRSASTVKIIYTRYCNGAVWTPQAQDIFPLRASDEHGGASDTQTEFEPSRRAVLEKLLPLYVCGTVYGASVHSAVAEHCARRAAMKASSKNADDMIAELSAEYNSARQSTVTSQLIDIIGSAQAIGKV